MNSETVLTITSTLFLVLFVFLLFQFIVIVIALFKKQKYSTFTPELTVIIPCYNEEKSIGPCVDSIRKNTYDQKKITILVVDDKSTDNSRNVIKKMKGVTLLAQNHKGKSEALNLGVKHAKTEIVFAVDADTVIENDCIAKMVAPLKQKNIGATTGTSRVKNPANVLESFQNIEYHFMNLIRKSFTCVFKSGIWFFGVVAAYKKSALNKVGGFKTDTLTEDMDIALELHKAGYRTLHVHDAYVHTEVPRTVQELYNQRTRWWMGTLQALFKNKLFRKKETPSIHFLYLNQYWWSLYALLSLPVIIYQVLYWLPANMDTFSHAFGYLFRWFTLSGPFYVLYKIPEWGLHYNNFFGVFSGIISAICIILGIYTFRDKLTWRNILSTFFYFPYTILLNIIIALSIITYKFRKQKYFID